MLQTVALGLIPCSRRTQGCMCNLLLVITPHRMGQTSDAWQLLNGGELVRTSSRVARSFSSADNTASKVSRFPTRAAIVKMVRSWYVFNITLATWHFMQVYQAETGNDQIQCGFSLHLIHKHADNEPPRQQMTANGQACIDWTTHRSTNRTHNVGSTHSSAYSSA